MPIDLIPRTPRNPRSADCPNPTPTWPTPCERAMSAQLRPSPVDIARIWPKPGCGRDSAHTCRSLLKLGELCPTLGQHRPREAQIWLGIDQIRPKFDRLGAAFGQFRRDSAPVRTHLSRIRPTSPDVDQIWPDIPTTCSILGDVWQHGHSSELKRCCPKLARSRPMLVRFRPSLGRIQRCLRDFCLFCPARARFRRERHVGPPDPSSNSFQGFELSSSSARVV